MAKDTKAIRVFGELELDEGSLQIKTLMDIDEKGMGKEKATRKLLVDGWPKTLKQ